MADSNIGSLPGAASLNGDALFVAEQQGQAVKISGEQILRFANVETAEQVAQAAASANAAQESAAAAQTAIVKAPMIQNKTWWIWNQSAGEYQDTGISAVGPQGIPGPTASVNGVAPDEDGDILLSAGDVGAYSKAESDTALEAKAPGGFGLGTYVADAPKNAAGQADVNLITKTGFYRAIANTPSGGWYYILHMQYTDSMAFQVCRYASGSVAAVRNQMDGVWGPWEYINPPLIVGVEYRTVERYQEKPVYQKLVNFGTFPNTGTKSVTWADNGVVAAVIDVDLVTAVGVYIGGPTLSGAEFTATKTLLYIKSTGDYSATTGIFKLKYTKTTD